MAHHGEAPIEQKLVTAFNGFKAVQVKQVLDILKREPILVSLDQLEPKPFGEEKDRMPEVVEVGDDDPGVGPRDPPQLVAGLPDVQEVADQIGQDDVIECAGNRQRLRVAHSECDGGVLFSGDSNHPFADVDSNTPPRTKVADQVAGAASDLQHRIAGEHH